MLDILSIEMDRLKWIVVKLIKKNADYEKEREKRLAQIDRLWGDMREQALYELHTDFESRGLRLKRLIKKLNSYSDYVNEQLTAHMLSIASLDNTNELINRYIQNADGEALYSLKSLDESCFSTTFAFNALDYKEPVGIIERIITLLKTPAFKHKLTHLHLQGFLFTNSLDDFINAIKHLSGLKILSLNNNSLETRAAEKLLEELKDQNIELISLANNFIDIHSFINKMKITSCKTKFDLTGNILRITKIDDISKTESRIQNCNNLILHSISETTSYLSNKIILTAKQWCVYLVASNTEHSFFPSHASLVIEGLTETGVHIFTCAHLKPERQNYSMSNCVSWKALAVSLVWEVKPVIEFYNKTDMNFKDEIKRLNNGHEYFGIELSSTIAINLFIDICNDIEHGLDGKFSLIPDSLFGDKSKSNKNYTCLRWALEKINKYISDKTPIEGESPLRTVRKCNEELTMDISSFSSHFNK